MNILKKILLAGLSIIAIAAAGLYFLPDHYEISNSIEINKPVDVVFAEVSDYAKWKDWGPWLEMEPDAATTFEGTPGTVGHKMTWDGKKLGQGSATLSDVNKNVDLSADLDFIKPMKSTAKDHWKFESIGENTKATWISSGELAYPTGRFFGLFVEKMIGNTERHGLDNLKKVCEAIEVLPPVAMTDSVSATPTY